MTLLFILLQNYSRTYFEAAESQRTESHFAYKVRSDSFQQEVKAKCLERKDTWANEVLARNVYWPLSAYTTKVIALSLDWGETQMKFVMNHLPSRETLYLVEYLLLNEKMPFCNL